MTRNYRPTYESGTTAWDKIDAALGDREERSIGNNTRAYRGSPDHTIGVQYHQTEVFVAHPDGRVVLDSGGWQTYTTKERLNWFLPMGVSVYQKAFKWYVVVNPLNDEGFPDWDHGVTLDFHDGMIVDPAAILASR